MPRKVMQSRQSRAGVLRSLVAVVAVAAAGTAAGHAPASVAPERTASPADSGSALRGLTASEALAVARRVHGDSVARAPWRALRLRAGERVDEYLGDHTAVVDRGPGRKGAVVRSTTPLRVRDGDGVKRPTDLTLRDRGSAVGPANALISSRIGRRASDGFDLPDIDVGVRPAGVRDVAGTVLGDKVFFANAAADTDLSVVALPAGAQVFAHLRSPASPERVAFDLDLPRGARAEPNARTGSIDVVRGSRTVARVAPPVAWDARRRPVRSRYELAGDRLTLVVAHRDADVAYPLVADPAVVEDFRSWRSNANMDFNGWNYEPANPDAIKAYYPDWYLGRGLYMYNRTTTQAFTGKEHRRWYFNVLGFGDAYIYRTDFTDMVHTAASSCATQGIFSRTAGAYEPGAYAEQCGSYGDYRPQTVCARSDCEPTDSERRPAASRGNAAMAGLRTTAPSVGANFTAYLGGAAVYQYDTVKPVMTATGIPDGFVESASQMKVRGVDTGMGMRSVRLSSPAKADWNQNRYFEPLAGCYDRNNRCAKILEPDAFATGDLPEGRDVPIRATGTDLVGDVTATDFPIDIDRSPPRIDVVSGKLHDHRNQLVDHRAEGVYDRENALHVEASDALAGMGSVEVFVDDVSQAPNGGRADGGVLDWTLDADRFSDGRHTIKVVAKDRLADAAGATPELHTTVRSFDVVIDRRGDIYHATQFNSDPAEGLELDVSEWYKAGTQVARRTDTYAIATRGNEPCDDNAPDGPKCAVVRERARQSESNPDDGDTYTVYRGSSTTDPNIMDVADIVDTVRSPDGDVVASGPIADAAAPGQHLPPAHGATYDLHRVTTSGDSTPDVTDVWVDAATGLPIKAEHRGHDGTIFNRQLFDYDVQRLTDGEAPAGLFKVAPPDKEDSSKENTYTASSRTMGTRRDAQTGSVFVPQFLGATALVAGQPFCLSGSNFVTYDDRMPADAAGAPDASDPGAKVSFVDAYYVRVQGAASCLTESEEMDTPPMTVRTMSTSSQYAKSLAAQYTSVAAEVSTTPLRDDALVAGTVPVIAGGTPTTAYVISIDGDTRSMYLVTGQTSTIVTGPFAKSDAPAIANLLQQR